MRTIIGLLALMLASAPASFAAQYFVATTGSDANPGTQAAPFASVQRGVDAAVAGDTVTVRAGVYLFQGVQDAMAVTIDKAGSPSAGRITLEGESGAILDGNRLCHSYFNLGSAAAFITIRGFEIRNTRWSGIWANGSASNDIYVKGNTIHHVGNRTETSSLGIAGVFVDTAGLNWRLDGNTFYSIGRTGGQLSGGLDHDLYVSGKNVIIENNVFYGLLNGWGVQTADGFAGKILANTFMGPDPAGSQPGQIMLWNSSSNQEIKNNVFYDPRAAAITTLTPSISGTCQIQNNIVFSPTDAGLALITSLPPGCSQSGNLLNVDPQLLGPPYDFRIAQTSPARNAGLALPDVRTDFFDTPRPQGAGFDIGAFEAPSTTTLFTTQVPKSGDFSPGSQSIEVGVRLKFDVPGQITAVRFWKRSNNNGTHTGHVWTSAGALLGSVTFAGETASGWQTATLPSPVSVSSTAVYIVSYHTPKTYSVTRNFFTSPLDHAPMHAPANTSAAPNGVYQYGAGAVFPTLGVQSSNFWADAVFLPASPSPKPVPAISGLSPNAAPAGSSALTVQVAGSGFVAGSQALWNGAPRATTVSSASQLSLAVSSSDLALGATDFVSVANPPPEGGESLLAPFRVDNPKPALSSIAPSSAAAGGPGFTLTAFGSSFVSTSTVLWNGSARATTFQSAAQLSADILAADIASSGTARVQVFTAGPAGGLSGAALFSISAASNPVPSISALSPSSATAGGSGFTLTVLGSGFVSTSTVLWNGEERATSFVSSASLTAAVLPADIASTGTAAVTVFNAQPGGGLSAPATFTIEPPNPAPELASISPSSATAGSAAFLLEVLGSGFVSTSTVLWNGAARPTTFVDTGTLRAQISTADVASGGLEAVSVFNAPPGGGLSSTATFTVVNPAPELVSLSPSTAAAGGPGFTLSVQGSGFVSTSTVLWNGEARPTVFASSVSLSAQIGPADVASTGTALVSVFNAAPGGGLSSTAAVEAVFPPPEASALSPSSATVGAPGFTLSVLGSGFFSTSTVLWNGQPRATTFVSSTSLSIEVSSGDLVSTGTAVVRVFTGAPGGGLSGPLFFEINPSGNPLPAVSALSPGTVPAGSGAFTLQVLGSGFVSTSTVLWNGGARATTFVDTGALTAQISAIDVSTSGTAQVTVFNAAPGGGLSNAFAFVIATGPPPAVQPTPGPTDRFGIRRLYPTAFGGKEWTEKWDNGVPRTLTFGPDPDDAWFDAHGDATYAIDGHGTLSASGTTVRLYVHDPDVLVQNSWCNVEFTIYGMRVADNNTAWSGIASAVRTNHGTTGSETVDLCDTRGILSRMRNDGHIDFEKETSHPNATPVANLPFFANGLPFNTWIGYKHVVYDLPNGHVKQELYYDASDGAGGGDWVRINEFEDNGANFGVGGVACASGIDPALALTNSDDRPGTESGKPNIAVYFRADGVGTNGFLYKRVSVREISPAVVVSSVPLIASLSPSSATAGSPAFSLTVLGAGFLSTSTALWNGQPRPTTFVGPTQLSVAISSSDLAVAATDFVAVADADGTTSPPVGFLVGWPLPRIAALAPSSATAGSPGLTLDVLGSGFVSTSTVLWNGAGRATTFVSSAELSIELSSADVASPASDQVSVFNPAPGGGLSNAAAFTVTSGTGPAPSSSTTTLFTTQIPASGDWSPGSSSIELGVRFKTDVPGQVTAIRFYKRSNNTGTHTGHLWTSAGALLGSVTFAGETASGWQTAVFPTPISISTGFVYVASYHTPNTYQVTRNYFVSQFDHPPLHALADSSSAHDGCYQYGTGAVFPTQGTQASNWWADVVFAPSSDPPSALAASSLSPAAAPPGGPAAAAPDLDSVRVYPNPWRSDRDGALSVTIDGLTPESRVRIFTVSGRFVRALDAAGGVGKWDLTDDSGRRVSSGIYLYLITDPYGRRRSGTLGIVR